MNDAAPASDSADLFGPATLARIATVLGADATTPSPGLSRYVLVGDARSLSVEISTHLELPAALADLPSNVVTVLGRESLVQLHGVTAVVTSEELGEVIFLSRRGTSLSGLVVEKGVGCSLYAHVDERLLSADFMTLPAELAMSSIALSLAETFFDDPA